MRTREGIWRAAAAAGMVLTALGSAPPVVAATAACGIYCGTERWAVKTLADADHVKVNPTVKDTTVSWLAGQLAPVDLPPDGRVAPIETQTYRVRALLIQVKQEKDHDYHLVLEDPEHPGTTMIAEIPDPSCSGACASGMDSVFRHARKEVVKNVGTAPISGSKEIRKKPLVEVTGVGFFDRIHGQTGVAPNGIELHPVLKIEFVDSGHPVAAGEEKAAAPTASATVQAADPGQVVYVTRTGKKYHRAGCRFLAKSSIPMPLKEAAARYQPCHVCSPPVLGSAGSVAPTSPQKAVSGASAASPDDVRAPSGSSEDPTVYVTRTGSKYHRAGCRYLAKSAIPMRLSEASKSYGPCSVCRPPVVEKRSDELHGAPRLFQMDTPLREVA